MIRLRRLLGLGAALALAACAAVGSAQRPILPAEDGWTPQVIQTRAVSLGLPGGAELAPGVRFIGGLQISARVSIDPAAHTKALHTLLSLL